MMELQDEDEIDVDGLSSNHCIANSIAYPAACVEHGHGGERASIIRRISLRSKKSLLFLALAMASVMSVVNDVVLEPAALLDPERAEPIARSLPLNDADASTSRQTSIIGPTFVFIMGLEGTGHHYVSSLLAQSPNMKMAKELGMCYSTSSSSPAGEGELVKLSSQFFDMGNEGRLFNPAKRQKLNFDASQRYDIIVDTMRTIRQKFHEGLEDEDAQTNYISSPVHIALNANSCGRSSMISYPNYHGQDRALQIFNLDVYYSACADAQVNCKHAFLYRDPHGVIESSTVKRGFNDNVYDAIRLYTSALQQIHSQMVSYPNGNVGCFGFLNERLGSHSQHELERFSNLFGWDSFDNFMAHAKMITKKRPKTTIILEEARRVNMVPSHLLVLMKALEDINNRVVDFCYSSLDSMR